ncbi:MAG TPA: hypothetical protein VID94_01680 [Acidimicrobiales bacterium]
MSTVVLTLVVVGGSIAVAARLAVSGESKPATEPPVRHRARRREAKAARRAAAASSAAVAEGVRPRPSLLIRLRAGVALVVVMAMIGAGIALGLLFGAQVISRTLETAVQ